MKTNDQTRKGRNAHWLTLSAVALALSASGIVQAQVSTATVKGSVSEGSGSAKAGTEVLAVNKATGFVYRARVNALGGYALTGLAPGVYDLRLAGAQSGQTVNVAVGETASIDLVVRGGTLQLDRVDVVGASQRQDVRTSEVSTGVSRAQIENLPQVTRNFLAFADQAPGVRFSTDASGIVKLQGGAQNQDNVNVFVDGVSQKNNILRGGISGLDASRGNPFPQSAVAEYKVLAQNYKAEYDQVSSTAISLVTKSGTNELHGDVFMDHTQTGWTAKNPFEKQAEKRDGTLRPGSSQDQYGFSIGGPIKQDVLHYFLAYEGKRIEDSRVPTRQQTDLVSAIPSNTPGGAVLAGIGGTDQLRFTEHLLNGKLTAQIDANQKLDFSMRVRRETDKIAEDRNLSAPGNTKDRDNNETRFDLKHEWTRGDYLNEARISYDDYTWNPHSSASAPLVKWYVGRQKLNPNGTPITTGKISDQYDLFSVLYTGGSPDAQNRKQKGFALQDDLTYTGLANHTVKGGFKFRRAEYDLDGTANSVDTVGKFIAPNGSIVDLNSTNSNLNLPTAIAPVGVTLKNNQFGLYLQDDWQINKKLEINAGLRWDYESNMLNNDYKTPADRTKIFDQQDPRSGAPAGQTYRQSLALGGVNIDNYISTGSSRKAFTGALAPRLGFSYDVQGDKRTVAFGGWGRAYDRTMANHALDERQKNAQPGGEIWMINNNTKTPFTDQFTLGLRQAVANWNAELGYTNSRSRNQFIWYGGNRDPKGGWGTQSPIDPLWGSVPGYGTLILGDSVGQAKTETVYLKMDKPYTTASGWGVYTTYTYSDGKTTNKEWTNDIFDWTYGKSSRGWNPSKDVERHRFVGSAVLDGLLPYVTVAPKLTVGSGLPRRLTDCSAGWDQCVSRKGDGGSFAQFDLSFAAAVPVSRYKVKVRLDVINVFNKTNYGGFDDWVGGPGNPQNAYGGDNANLGTPNGMAGPMRTFKLGLSASF